LISTGAIRPVAEGKMAMKYLFAGLMFLLVATGNAAAALPPELTGIWAITGSQFHGDAVWKGQAIYLDTDGVGAIVGGDGSDVLGVRIVVTSYDVSSNVIHFDLTEDGKVLQHQTLAFDKKDHALVSPKDSLRYFRRASQVSAMMRKSLGLEGHP
jgi:hypothetical protein